MDIALQHVSDKILERMRRNFTRDETYRLVDRFREQVPGICLRTTMMVGFPGETEADFEELLNFVRYARFDRLGAFAYSEEEGTWAASHYKDNVPRKVKQERLDRLMALQQQIATEDNEKKVGLTLKVMVDRKEGEYWVGRTEFDSPEVDPEVLIPAAGRRLKAGTFYQVKITGTDEFDLYGDIVKNKN